MYPVIINNFGIKLREGGKYFNGFLTMNVINAEIPLFVLLEVKLNVIISLLRE